MATDSARPIASTTSGPVQGFVENGIAGFRGIPYAATTAGKSRWLPPTPVSGWSDVRDATQTPPACPQIVLGDVPEEVRRVTGYSDPEVQSEDCLHVNVWTPGCDDARRPVMVWLHGGEFSIGSGSLSLYDGQHLARRGDVVVVNVTHRLGILGYWYLGGVLGSDYAASGNAGTLDQIAALQWVRENIEEFGGDPGNVTIFGESGGGAKVNVLLVAPAARGLFHRAICMSGVTGGIMPLPTPEVTEPDTGALLDELGLTTDTATKLFELPVDRLHQAELAVAGGIEHPVLFPGGLHWRPLIDGEVLPESPLEAVTSGHAADVPLIVGTTEHEATVFMTAKPDYFTMDDAGLVQRVGDIVGEEAGRKLIAGYRATRPAATTQELLISITTDWMMRVPSIQLAEGRLQAATANTYMYWFSWRTPALGGVLGAGHGLDVSLVFHNPKHAPITSDYPETIEISDVMADAWISFARSGDPNNAGLPTWPTYDLDNRATMTFDATCRVELDPNGHERRLWT